MVCKVDTHKCNFWTHSFKELSIQLAHAFFNIQLLCLKSWQRELHDIGLSPDTGVFQTDYSNTRKHLKTLVSMKRLIWGSNIQTYVVLDYILTV